MAQRRQRTYPRGRSANLPDPLEEQFDSASANLQQQLFRRVLLLTVGGSYTHSTGYVESTAHGLTGSLSWRIGKLELLAGTTLSESETEGTTFLSSSRSYRYYYFRLRREF
jgi:hypothetical protein